MPDTNFTFRVDAALKEAFAEAAKAADRPGSQLLRDFMRDYVERAAHDAWFREEVALAMREADDPATPRIPHEEVMSDWKAQRRRLLQARSDRPIDDPE